MCCSLSTAAVLGIKWKIFIDEKRIFVIIHRYAISQQLHRGKKIESERKKRKKEKQRNREKDKKRKRKNRGREKERKRKREREM